jgi:large-conductance mechanosensitive channel
MSIVKKLSKLPNDRKGVIGLVFVVAVGTELFHAINSLKLNLIMPTVANVFKESTVRSWQISNGTICVRVGNFVWDMLSVVVFVSLAWLLWRFVVRRFVK